MAQTPSPLIFWAPPETAQADLAAALAALAGDRAELHSSPETASSALRARAGARLCLLYRSCESTLAQALQDGADPGPLLEDWKAGARALLAVQRPARRRSLLLECDHFHRFASTGLARLGLPEEGLGDLPELPAPDALTLLIAQELLKGDREALALAEELEAGTQSLSNEDIPRARISAARAVASHAARSQALEALEAAQDETRAALESARAEQEDTRHQLMAAGAALAKTEEARQASDTARQAAEEALARAKEAAEAQQQEQAALEQQRAALQKDRDAQAARARELTEALARSQQEQARLTELAEATRAAQEREISGLGRQLETDSAARALMQRELLQAATAQAATEAQLTRAQTQLTESQGRIAALEDARRQAHDDLGTLQGQLDQEQARARDLEGEIERLWRSSSMRLTAPLRRVMGLFRRGGHD